MTTGSSRAVIVSYLAKIGIAAMWASSSRRRSAPWVTLVRAWKVSVPTSTVTMGSAAMLATHSACSSRPLFEPTTT